MGYFIKNQLPERAQDERIDLWLGLVKDVHRVAQRLKLNPHTLKIVNEAHKAFGYHSPVRIHLCGDWASHGDLRDIKYYFDRLAATKMLDIEWVREK